MTSKDTISQIHFNLEMMDVTDLTVPCCPCTLQEALNFKMHNPLTQNIQSPPDSKVKMKVKSLSRFVTPVDCSLPGSAIHGIFQVRILEWAAISFSRGSFQPRDQTRVSSIADRHFPVWATGEAQMQTPKRNANLRLFKKKYSTGNSTDSVQG